MNCDSARSQLGEQCILLIKPPPSPRIVGGAQVASLGALELEHVAGALGPARCSILDLSQVQLATDCGKAAQELRLHLQRYLVDARVFGFGITGYTSQVPNMRRLVNEIRRSRGEEAFVFVGGVHASLFPSDLQHMGVNAICTGSFGMTEGRTLLAAVEAFRARRAGAASSTRPLLIKSSGSGIMARHLYWQHRGMLPALGRVGWFERVFPVVTAAGCDQRCPFCVCWRLTQGQIRRRDDRDVEGELALAQEAGAQYLYFCEDNLLASDYAMHLAGVLRRVGWCKGFLAYGSVRQILRSAAALAELRNVGLTQLVVGVEATSDADLARLGKAQRVEDVSRAIALCHGLGIEVCAQFIVCPWHTAAVIPRLYGFCSSHALSLPMLSFYTPFRSKKLRADESALEHMDLNHALHRVFSEHTADLYAATARFYRDAYSPAAQRLADLRRSWPLRSESEYRRRAEAGAALGEAYERLIDLKGDRASTAPGPCDRLLGHSRST